MKTLIKLQNNSFLFNTVTTNLNQLKLKFRFTVTLSMFQVINSHNVAGGYHTGRCRQRTLASLQKWCQSNLMRGRYEPPSNFSFVCGYLLFSLTHLNVFELLIISLFNCSWYSLLYSFQVYKLMKWSPDKANTHLMPHIVITILSTLFPMLYFTLLSI